MRIEARHTPTLEYVRTATHYAVPKIQNHSDNNQRKEYMVPCVRARLEGYLSETTQQVQWWPILGLWHEDEDIIEYGWYHWHIDWRFVTKETSDETIKRLSYEDHNELLSKVILHDEIVPEGEDRYSTWPITLQQDDRLPLTAVRKWFRYQIMIESGEPNLKWPDSPWREDLEKAFDNTRMKMNGRLRCPHRGADLSAIEPDEHGVVECPLHGLKWCTRTGNMVRS